MIERSPKIMHYRLLFIKVNDYLNIFNFEMSLELAYAKYCEIKMNLELHVVFTLYWIGDIKSLLTSL